ncbi:Crp/Fnr family transcriptional regulator [Dichotomicrobium thermohalophilum]|uniref:CRP/FNR family transcriptional regulator n=1 Tax=Dichotomicrobium thermohalophilum TaxID=933063 RepID=A0A397Q4X5_9HYPH|nr:Crp/Fnr family transcriptional regulator [Dichotomicrobium thermohalophilum]RIA56152.1 CRP/FNR family transcriptional regulator [Dichotomicrobium thermohalophilum]
MTPRVPNGDFSTLADRLQNTPLWSALADEERERILLGARMVTAHKSEVLIEEGELAQALFIVVGGALRLTRINGRGHRIIAGFLFRGDLVGACIADRYPFSVEAIDEVVLCRFERRHIREMNRENHGLEWRMITAASNEFLQCQTHLDIVMGGSVEAKLARFLLHIGGRIGEPVSDGTHIQLPMSREDIAHYLGHSLETVSRAFTKLREHGAIATPHRTQLVITDNSRLAEIAETDG